MTTTASTICADVARRQRRQYWGVSVTERMFERSMRERVFVIEEDKQIAAFAPYHSAQTVPRQRWLSRSTIDHHWGARLVALSLPLGSQGWASASCPLWCGRIKRSNPCHQAR